MSASTLTQSFREIKTPGYEKVIEVKDLQVGLHAIIAIHSTALGPALGGTRFYPYPTFEDGLNDVLRLSEGMSHKWTFAGGVLGGGKSVIFGDPKKVKTPELLEAFGRAVDSLNGMYICAEDSGLVPEDLLHIRKGTKYIVGIQSEGSSGNPSPFTAWGVFRGIEATCKKLFGTNSVESKTIAIQGVGLVGEELAGLLFWRGARLKIADVDTKKVAKVAAKYGAEVVDPVDILSTNCDIFAPCALGAVINDTTVLKFKCRAIVGSANNILDRTDHGRMLKNQGILCAPDFIVNAGGAINVVSELEPEPYNIHKARKMVDEIYDTTLEIYNMAESKNLTPMEAALTLSNYKLQNKLNARSYPVVFHH